MQKYEYTFDVEGHTVVAPIACGNCKRTKWCETTHCPECPDSDTCPECSK